MGANLKRFLKLLLKIVVFILLLLGIIALTLAYFRPSGLSPVSLIVTQFAKRNYAWQCSSPLVQQPINRKGNIVWTKLQCQGVYPWSFSHKKTDRLTINIVDANFNDPHTFAIPTIGKADANHKYRSTLLDQIPPYAVAGINGGYFRTKPGRRDQNCIRRSVNKPLDTPNHVGESLLVIQNQKYSTNCDGGVWAEEGRSSLIQDATTGQWRIERVKYDAVPENTKNAIGAGPGLIQTLGGKPQIQITWEGILSTFEYSANAAVILATDKQGNPHMLFFTVDGIDREYGMTSISMANFIYTQIPSLLDLKLVSAMSMDQGNSTTMFVKNDRNPIVSATGKHGAIRDVYDALFIVVNPSP